MGPDHHEIAPLISKYLQKNISEEEMSTLQRWLEASDENKQLLISLEREGYAKEEIEFLDKIDVNRAWKRVKGKKTGRGDSFPWKKCIAAVAAIGIFVVGLKLYDAASPSCMEEPAIALEKGTDRLPGAKKAELILSDGTTLDLGKHFDQVKERDGTKIRDKYGALDYSKHHTATTDKPIYNTLRVPKTGTYQLTLPDGTNVWVNALSTLKFPVQFVGKERVVYLEGEAYFEVAADQKRPFIVDVKGTEIQVLGTQFNVNSYNTYTTTTLVEGSVKVASGGNSKLIKPGEEVRTAGDTFRVGSANMAKVLAWKEGDFYFEKDNIIEIMQQLQRWYDVDIEYKGEKPDVLFSGNITRSSKLSEVLEMLTFVSDNATRFKVQDRKVEVSFNTQ